MESVARDRLTWPDSSSHMTMPKLYTSALGVSCDCDRSSGGMYGMVCRGDSSRLSGLCIPCMEYQQALLSS